MNHFRQETEESAFVRHIPCPSCGSRDANSIYTDGHQHCFSCGYHTNGTDEVPMTTRRKSMSLIDGEFKELRKRRIDEDTCRKFGYLQGEYQGKPVQIAEYRNRDGEVVAQKLRFADKTFKFIGKPKEATLYGAHLWSGGKKIVVTEGEIDALSVSQVQSNKWPVVSVPNGAPGAAKAIKMNLDYLDQFEEVIFMFDMDEPGREAASECAQLFAPGRAKIAQLPLKDANDMLVSGKGGDIVNAIWQAKPWRPDGIVAGTDLLDSLLVDDTCDSIPYPWEGLNAMTFGLRTSELVTVTSGSGMGKSAVVRELAYHLLMNNQKVGMLMLEESTKRTALGLTGIAMNRPLHLSREGVDQEDIKKHWMMLNGNENLYLYDHFGSTDVDNLLSRVRFMAKGYDCKWIILDHLSIVVSGIGEGDERRLIDNAMTMLRTLVQELDIGLILVSHLKRPEGKGHENGGETSLAQLRGSAAIAQLSDMVLGLERNQQGDNPHLSKIRVLKNRYSGMTGVATNLKYDPSTGRLEEIEVDEEGNPLFQDETFTPASGSSQVHLADDAPF